MSQKPSVFGRRNGPKSNARILKGQQLSGYTLVGRSDYRIGSFYLGIDYVVQPQEVFTGRAESSVVRVSDAGYRAGFREGRGDDAAGDRLKD